jgi:hypothetical protein
MMVVPTKVFASGEHSFFVFERSWIHISAEKPAVMFRGFFQSPQTKFLENLKLCHVRFLLILYVLKSIS